jgi:hypothetical protein
VWKEIEPMKWNRHGVGLVLAVAVTGLLVAVAASGSGRAPARAPQAPQVQVSQIEASWAGGYGSLGALKNASDLAIIGTVTGVSAQTVRNGLPFTDFTVRVVRTLHDPQSRLASSSTITLHQTGGQVAPNRRVEIHDDPLFRAGETAAMFLREFTPGHYYVLGGPAGRFEVSRGTVASIHDGMIRLPANHPVDQFANEVARA